MQIQSWMSAIGEEACGKKASIPVEATPSNQSLVPNTGVTLDELAPRNWIPVILGTKSPQAFWEEVKNAEYPGPFDIGDLIGVKPWWTLYRDNTSSALKPYVHPELRGPDPDEMQHERLARENDFGSAHHSENRKRTENAKRDAKRDQRKRAQQKADAIRKLAGTPSTQVRSRLQTPGQL